MWQNYPRGGVCSTPADPCQRSLGGITAVKIWESVKMQTCKNYPLLALVGKFLWECVVICGLFPTLVWDLTSVSIKAGRNWFLNVNEVSPDHEGALSLEEMLEFVKVFLPKKCKMYIVQHILHIIATRHLHISYRGIIITKRRDWLS